MLVSVPSTRTADVCVDIQPAPTKAELAECPGATFATGTCEYGLAEFVLEVHKEPTYLVAHEQNLPQSTLSLTYGFRNAVTTTRWLFR